MKFVGEVKESFSDWINKRRFGEIEQAISQEEVVILNGEVTSVVRLGEPNFGGTSYSHDGTTYSNVVNLVTIEGVGMCIGKPRSGEKPKLRRGVEAGSYCYRERSAYLVDQALGFNLVPTTVIRDVRGEISSVQKFVPDGETVANMTMKKYKERKQNPDFQAQAEMLTVLDYLIYNLDRHDSNLLINGDGIHAIDNSLTFSDNVLSTLESAVDQSISVKVRDMVHQLAVDNRKFFQLTTELSKLLKPSEVRAFKNRLKFLDSYMQKTGCLPPPPVMYDPYN